MQAGAQVLSASRPSAVQLPRIPPFMAPKLISTQIDAKLAELRKFVEENLATLSQRRGTTLAKSLQQNQSADERKWYMLLTKNL